MSDETNANRGAHEPDLNLLAAHWDGRLGVEESAKLAAHLADCRGCRETAALMARSLAGDAARRTGRPAGAGWLALAATLLLASVVGIRVARDRPSLAAAPEPDVRPTIAAAAAPPPETTTTPAPPPAAAPPDVKRGGAQRKIAEKTFHLVAGEWVDAAYDRTAGLPTIEIAGREARDKLLAERPEAAPYLALGDRVLLVLGGSVYRIGPAEP